MGRTSLVGKRGLALVLVSEPSGGRHAGGLLTLSRCRRTNSYLALLITASNGGVVACTHCSRRDVGTVPAGDGEGRAADHARLVGGQKGNYRGDVLGF
jgi:hypothetical protein